MNDFDVGDNLILKHDTWTASVSLHKNNIVYRIIKKTEEYLFIETDKSYANSYPEGAPWTHTQAKQLFVKLSDIV